MAQQNADKKLNRYYNFHSKIYDLTRWTFLFGRKRIIDLIPEDANPSVIGEVGCGTGKNISFLVQRFSNSEIRGYDLASAMIKVARRKFQNNPKVELHDKAYECEDAGNPRFDLMLASYCLSMINPGYEKVVEDMKTDLKPGSYLAVVDFHSSPFGWFKKWMGVNHVRMEAHLLPELEKDMDTVFCKVVSAYGGWWKYLLWVGKKPMP
jgi:S-adenosylmethionine-diacylgycerolhomoserine-N-methlytransferase